MEIKGAIAVIFFFLLSCHHGTALQCYSCDFPCIMKSNITCQAQEVCLKKQGEILHVPTSKRGCGNPSVCDTMTTENTAGSSISVMNYCCKTDMCNSAHHLEVPAFSILAAILAVYISKLG